MTGPTSTSRQHPVTWDSALRISAGAAAPREFEELPLADAVGRVSARGVSALQAIPHYVSSAMDGWAVAGDPPWLLRKTYGSADAATLTAGTARPIVTGGLVPLGADAVLRTEHGVCADGMLRPRERAMLPRPGGDIRPAGEEAAAGELLIPAGTVLNPAHVAVLAACARDFVEVIALPRVRLLLTGEEVVASGVPAAGQVRDSFGPTLPALIREWGGAVIGMQRVADRLDATIAAIGDTGSELIITTGGSGGSGVDHVRAALDALDAEMLIPGIAVRPGGPTLLARLPDGRLVAGVAGNPLAAIVGLLLVAAPALARWSGRAAPDTTEVVAASSFAGHPTGDSMVPFRRVAGAVVPSSWIGSGMMRGLADSDGIAVIPPGGLAELGRTRALSLPW